ncbi:Siderophore iron transporter mirA [Exophiala dermatitidis]
MRVKLFQAVNNTTGNEQKPPKEAVLKEQDIQTGALKAELVHAQWTKKGVIIAYVGLFATTWIINMMTYSVTVYQPYATSAFKQHSLITTAGIVENIATVASYPIIAKLSDVFGRAEGLSLSIAFIVLGLILSAACQDIETYVASGIFDAIGNTGFTIMQQVFIADTTKLINRGIWSSLVDAVVVVPMLYVGTIIGDSVLKHSTWRWGYGMWAIILPVAAIPMIVILGYYQRRSKKTMETENQKLAILRGLPDRASFSRKAFHLLYIELDLVGAILLTAGLALTLVPLSITGSNNSHKWGDASTISMIVIGVILLAVFFVWDTRYAQKPFVPYRMIRERTVIAACFIGLVDFVAYGALATFFSSYLQVAGHYHAGHATRINNAIRVTFQVASVLVGFLMRFTNRTQMFVYIGVPIAVIGHGIMIYLCNVDGERAGNEASLVTSKVLVGLGRGFYQTASLVSCQALVTRQEIAVVTAIFMASMSIGGSIGKSMAGAI